MQKLNSGFPVWCLLGLFLFSSLAGCGDVVQVLDYILDDDYSYYYNDDYYSDDDDDDDYYEDRYYRQRPAAGRDNYRAGTYEHTNTTAMARDVLDLVNQQRRRNGAGSLAWDSTAAKIAQQRAQETTRYFSHTRPNGSSWDSLLKQYNVRASYWGENIAYGQEDGDEVMDAWMNSSGHRQNILNRNYNRLGVGCYQADNGQLYWVQIFLRK